VSYKCEFCDKEFRRESTLSLHNCEQKKRAVMKNDMGVQMGFQAYLHFYDITQGSSKLKTYGDFADSPYYTAFVKFGTHLRRISATAPMVYTDWLIRQNKKLDKWCRDDYYEEFLLQYLKTEKAEEAVERFIEHCVGWSETSEAEYNHIFWLGNAKKLCYYITLGKISPWIVYNCESGVKFLEELNEEEVQYIYKWIDPAFWQKKFVDYIGETEWVKSTLKEAGY
jgi:hypothetical protein